MTPATRAVQTVPYLGASNCRARNGTQRPSLILPRMPNRAPAAQGVPGSIAALK